MNILKRIFSKKKSKQEHNLNVSANIGLLVVDQLSRDRSFRRMLSLKYPELTRNLDNQINKIQA